MQRRSTALCLAVVGLLASAFGIRPVAAERWDLVVVAPHSDDEAIGCTGAMLRALGQGKRVGVVVLTAGDAHVRAAAAAAKKPIDQLSPPDFVNLAALRQRHTLAAMTQLGLSADNLLFLGYPDGGMAAIYEAKDSAPYRQPYTGQSETYGPVVRDYHFQAHGRSAPYVRQAVIDDLAEILKTRRPQQIYTTNEVDTHPDHRATFWFVRDAAKTAGYEGPLFTYVVHGKPPADPPGLRLSLSEAELQRKRATIEIYQSDVSPVHDDLAEHYTLPEELFWPIKLADVLLPGK